MIYLTGDTHGHIDIQKLNLKNFPQQKDLTKEDYVIILGDFGLIWDDSKREQYWRRWLSCKPFTTLFIDGNHENFDMLEAFPDREMFGGTAQEITPSIFHLRRGQIYTIDGHTFFTMGGATSVDKDMRIPHVSWWPQEVPSHSEMENALNALDNASWNIDYVLTHCCPDSVFNFVCNNWKEPDAITKFLQEINEHLTFKKWYFGHYHVNKQVNEQFIALYDKIVPLG